MGAGSEGAGALSMAELATLSALFEEHRTRLGAMLRGRMDSALARRFGTDDLLQEIFLRARTAFPRFAGSGLSSYGWLYGIARDCLRDAWRRETRKGRDHRREMPWPERSSVQLGLSLAGSGTSPSQALARGELRERIRLVLSGLSEPEREVLWMRAVDELPFRDVAGVLEVSENTAMKRYARASRKFYAAWYGAECPDGEAP
jgi:RNA polymerase sigma factor (sigma-70 family)